jgi:hypothetical protein
MPILERLTPRVLTWCKELSEPINPLASPFEQALMEAVKVIEPALKAMARATVAGGLTPDIFDANEAELFDLLKLEVPPAMLGGGSASPWLIIGGAWLREVSLKDEPKSIASICQDGRLNEFLIKSIELSGIASIWSGA